MTRAPLAGSQLPHEIHIVRPPAFAPRERRQRRQGSISFGRPAVSVITGYTEATQFVRPLLRARGEARAAGGGRTLSPPADRYTFIKFIITVNLTNIVIF